MSRSIIILGSVAAGILVLLAGVVLVVISRSDSRRANEADEILAQVMMQRGRALPDYQLFDLERNSLIDDDLKRGRVLLIFLTTNCEACKKEVTLISQLDREMPPGLRVYGVGFEEPIASEASLMTSA